MTDKKKVKLYVTAVKLGYENEFKIEVNSFDKSTFDNHGGIAIPLSVVEVEIEIPTISGEQLQAEEVKPLQAAIKKEMADSHVRVVAIEEKIQSLMCIENQSEKVGG